MKTQKTIDIFLDAEWYMNQNIFLIGYSYDLKTFGQLYGKRLTRKNFKGLFHNLTGSIFCYGPDIGMLEKFFDWKFRDRFRCVNLMKVFRDFVKRGSFKLKDLEEKFGIKRKVLKYKTTIFDIWRDWRNKQKKKAVLHYNREDVINLVKLAKKIFRKFTISLKYLEKIRLK